MVAQGKNTGYNDCGQEEREERKSKNKREKEGKGEATVHKKGRNEAWTIKKLNRFYQIRKLLGK